jgi:membrane protein
MLGLPDVPLGLGEILKRTVKEAREDNVFDLAAQMAYYFFLALFPALLFVISVASFFAIANLVDEIIAGIGRFVPGDVVKIVSGQIMKISNSDAGGILTFAFLFTIWSSSGAMVSLISTLNHAYDIEEGRQWWKVRLTAILLTVAIAVFILVSFALVLVGPALATTLAGRFGLGAAFEWTWKILQWPVVFALVATAISMVYYFAPDAEQDWVWITPGSILATLLWLAISLGFKLYVTNWASYNETYGALGGVIVLLTWFYFSGVAILAGAEMNAVIEHASPHGKAPGEKVAGQKKKIGAAAARAWAARKTSMPESPPAADAPNCDLDVSARPLGPAPVRASDLLLGAPVVAATVWQRFRKVKR